MQCHFGRDLISGQLSTLTARAGREKRSTTANFSLEVKSVTLPEVAVISAARITTSSYQLCTLPLLALLATTLITYSPY